MIQRFIDTVPATPPVTKIRDLFILVTNATCLGDHNPRFNRAPGERKRNKQTSRLLRSNLRLPFTINEGERERGGVKWEVTPETRKRRPDVTAEVVTTTFTTRVGVRDVTPFMASCRKVVLVVICLC